MFEGEIVLSATRSGGSFDPMGCRMLDVCRRQDLRAVVATLPGRWVMVTLTIDRKQWTRPEFAYDAANERVRKVMEVVCPRGVWFAALEMQTRDGAGWPHWHCVAWVPDARSESELLRTAVKAWSIRRKHVNIDSGEMFFESLQLGIVHCGVAREAIAVGSYIAKYITKPWEAVPAWMGESRRRFRKVRCSPGVYQILEKLGRHIVHRGGRVERKGTGRGSRPLYERMARSGSTLTAFRRVGGRLQYAGLVRCPMDDDAPARLARYGGKFIRLGKLPACRVVMSGPEFERMKRLEYWYEETSAEYIDRRRAEVRAAWAEMQERRQREEGHDGLSAVA